MIVLDTNIVLDLLVFADPATQSLKDAFAVSRVQWIATPAMREELARVLSYPQIAPRLVHYQLSAGDVLAAFDRQAQLVGVAPKADMTCKDPDDQKFIDLAVAHQAQLLSKDHAVLQLKKRLLAQGVIAAKTLNAAAQTIEE